MSVERLLDAARTMGLLGVYALPGALVLDLLAVSSCQFSTYCRNWANQGCFEPCGVERRCCRRFGAHQAAIPSAYAHCGCNDEASLGVLNFNVGKLGYQPCASSQLFVRAGSVLNLLSEFSTLMSVSKTAATGACFAPPAWRT